MQSQKHSKPANFVAHTAAWASLLVAPALCSTEPEPEQRPPATIQLNDQDRDLISPLIDNPQEVESIINALESARFDENIQEGTLTNLQEQYFNAIAAQTFDHLEALYSAEQNGLTFSPTQRAEDAMLESGLVYQFFGGYTTQNETPPDDGVPGLARIPKRFLRQLENGSIARIDANEGYELSVENGELKATLVEIRVHYTSDLKIGVGTQVFHRLHVEWDGEKPTLSIKHDFDPQNVPIDIGDASHLAVPTSCYDCHVGTVAFQRTDEALLFQRPDLSEEELDERNDDAFRFDNFLPDSVYLGRRQIGLAEVLEKWAPVKREIAEQQTVALQSALADPGTFQSAGIVQALLTLKEKTPS